MRWRAASTARLRTASDCGLPRPWRAKALCSDGQVLSNSARPHSRYPAVRPGRRRVRLRPGPKGTGWAASLLGCIPVRDEVYVVYIAAILTSRLTALSSAAACCRVAHWVRTAVVKRITSRVISTRPALARHLALWDVWHVSHHDHQALGKVPDCWVHGLVMSRRAGVEWRRGRCGVSERRCYGLWRRRIRMARLRRRPWPRGAASVRIWEASSA